MISRKRKILKKILKWFLLSVMAIMGIAVFFLFWFGYGRISGFPTSEKTYLIVFQNNNELRPAGGFVTAYGLLTFKYGFFQDLQINNVYGTTDQHPYIKPDYPLNLLLEKGEPNLSYSFRDANFAPDFRYSAVELKKMLLLTRKDLQIDGVIAVNYSFLEDLLEKIGSVEVDGMKLDNNSLFSTLEYSVNDIDRHSLTDLANRKNILKNFSKALIRKIIYNPLLIGDSLYVTLNSLKKKDIQLYFEDEVLQNMVVERGWSGAWNERHNDDFLALNAANFGGLKADRYISKNISYDLQVSKESPNDEYKLRATTKVDVKYFGTKNIPISADYEGFLRLYVPEGVKLNSSDNKAIEGFREHTKGTLHVYEGLIKIKPGEEKSFSYTYDLPSSLIKNDQYSLYIPKQSGATSDNYSVIVTFPNGYVLSSDSFQIKENFAIYNGIPKQDLNLTLSFKKNSRPPFVTYQNIDSLSKIAVSFNEDVAPVNISNFLIKDTNEKVPKQTDTIKILGVKQEGNAIWLNISGMTYQNEERYNITINDIEDLDGNMITPNPRDITAVQRNIP